MAFNLNKNEGADPSKKFDLSKSSSPTTTGAEQEKSRSKTWLFALPVLLVAGIAAWYFLSNPGPHKENSIAAATAIDSNTANIASGDQNKVTTSPADTPADVKKENAGSSTIAATNSGNAVGTPGNTTNTSFNNKVPATFAKGSNSISNLDRSLVKDIIAFLEKNPAAVITVNGYASSEGDPAVNQQISRSRADAFKSYLVSKGITAGRINAAGKGIDNPISSNDTEEGRIKNRRVEISFQ